MPEIKHVFQQGKMEKDLDERLVKNGQYRDAMNIQVSTSEGSDVGTVQNILGNENLFSDNQIAPGSICVGAIADEKENCFYWFVYHNSKNLILRYKNNEVTFVFVDTMNVLNFNGNIITGVNIIDDFLLWTDNWSEPKKINIQRSIDGTRGGYYHTHLIVPKRYIIYEDCIKVREEHITVIKKSPKLKLVLDLVFDKNITAETDFNFTNALVGSGGNISFTNFNIQNSTYSANDIIILKDSNDVQAVRIKINSFDDQTNLYNFTLLSISIFAQSTQTYTSEVEDVKDLFERKFVRFGYRYKFNDGEYSTFSSFTDVVFKPDLFEYSSTDAYNKAMENKLVSLKLRNFVSKEMPEDVVQVDILYKESNSPLVYIVDKLKYSDPANITTGGLEKNYMQANMYEITSDLIYSLVSSNQLLRSFDNVPRKALAQEITGNRIVYGNYLQNYNIDQKPILEANYTTRFVNNGDFVFDYFENQTESPVPQPKLIDYLYGQKSLKSLRNYQLGLTYLDEYNRETPIFTGAESIFTVPKKFADNKLKIEGQVKTSPPSWAKSFKVYVKETSTEYYNLAMSRVYKAEDGNVWLSFPSSERNKVDEETFLILKKAIDTDNLVEEEAKYKILAIENEAPEYISNERTNFVEINCGSTNATDVFGVDSPVVNSKSFKIVDSSWLSGGTESMELVSGQLAVAFKNTSNNNFTTTYDIKSVSLDGSYYKITLDRVFETQDAEFIYPNYPNTTSGGVLDLDSNLKMIIYKKESIKESSQFKGMFFVKINNDETIENNVISSQNLNEYEIVNTAPTHSFIDGWYSTVLENTGLNKSDTLNNWKDLLDFGGSSNALFPNGHDFSGDTIGGFFIDNAFYIDIQTGSGAQYNDINSVGHIESNYRNVFQSWWEDSGMTGNFFDMYQLPLGGSNGNVVTIENRVWNWFNQKKAINAPGIQFNVSSLDGSGANVVQIALNNLGVTGYSGAQANFPNEPEYTSAPNLGQGIYTDASTGKHYVEISFSKIGLNADIQGNQGIVNNSNEPRYGNANNSSVFDFRINQTSKQNYATDYSATDNELNLIASNIATGKKFKVRSDDDITNIYTIKSVQKINRYNFENWFRVRSLWLYWVSNSNNPSPNTNGWGQFEDSWNSFMSAENRRYTFIIEVDHSLNDVQINNKDITHADNSGIAKSLSFQFLEPKYNESTKQKISDNPAIWETEPKESADLDIYYEASSIMPLNLDNKNNESFIPVGSVVTCVARPNTVVGFTYVTSWSDVKITFNNALDLNAYVGNPGDPLVRLRFTKPDNSYTTIAINTVATLADSSLAPNTYYVYPGVAKNPFALSWYNSFSFGNGVESNRIRDDFNQPTIDKGVKVSSVLEENYEEERRASGLIYSGIYNTIPGVNNLNQFIQAEKITKDLNPTYGSVQKLYSRSTADGDLIALCEDRVLKILANKDALFNADGNTNITSTNNVLGQAIPYAGEYGISKNPESFAGESYRAYFTDKQRGAVLRLSRDGLTPISEYGMSDHFKKSLKLSNKLIGSYDDKKQEYNITTSMPGNTVSYKEGVNGWSSFKSFAPEIGLSMSNNYYTIKNALPYKHHVEKFDNNGKEINRNTFYGVYTPSSIDVLLNESSSTIKSYKTLTYEGSQSKVNMEATRVETGYHNLQDKDGWSATYINTDKQSGFVPEFIEKEGRWFNNIKGLDIIATDIGIENTNLKTEEFAFQGVGKASVVEIDTSLYPIVYGCTRPLASNYNSDATIDDGSCVYVQPDVDDIIPGCMDPLSSNYNNEATYDDGSCILVCNDLVGCTDPLATNYDPGATIDNGSCSYYVNGGPRTTGGGSNNNTLIGGCTDQNANNYDPSATFDNGSCTYDIYGCTDPLASNYDPNATIDNGSCAYNQISFTAQDTNDDD